jgi:hypothetical protein
MKRTVYIGVDDTDVPGSPGTGRIARDIGLLMEDRGLGKLRGVIRHQLLVAEGIPYTSHNSAKCIEFETDGDLQSLANVCIYYFKENFLEGSDPGTCVVDKDAVSAKVIEFGNWAAAEVLTKEAAYGLAGDEGIILEEHGGTGGGVIGALAAVGLSAGGNAGRYVQLRGIKEVTGLVTVGALLRDTDIAAVVDERGEPLDEAATVDSLGWIRPSLIGGTPVLRVKAAGHPGRKDLWEPVLKSKKAQREGAGA